MKRSGSCLSSYMSDMGVLGQYMDFRVYNSEVHASQVVMDHDEKILRQYEQNLVLRDGGNL